MAEAAEEPKQLTKSETKIKKTPKKKGSKKKKVKIL